MGLAGFSHIKVLWALGFASIAVQAATTNFGATFLANIASRQGVRTLPSGLQYRVLRAGNSTGYPGLSTTCRVHYEGRTAENWPTGPKFDSSYDRGSPLTVKPNQVIKGWTIALQLMVQGDKWEIYVPSELGYGDEGVPPRIGGGDVLVFTMELLSILGHVIDTPPAELVSGNSSTSLLVMAFVLLVVCFLGVLFTAWTLGCFTSRARYMEIDSTSTGPETIGKSAGEGAE